MTHDHTHHTPEPQARMPWYRSWTGLAGLGAGAVAALYLSLYHVTHAIDALPLVLLFLWPTILTLAMFPLLVWMYVRLAHAEEREAFRTFGADYERYAAVTPAWFPHLPRRGSNRPRVGGASGA